MSDAGVSEVVVCQRLRASGVRGSAIQSYAMAKAGEEKAAEADFFEDGRGEGSENGDEPGGGRSEEEVVDG